MKKNPFKYGSIVDAPYFSHRDVRRTPYGEFPTNRYEEIKTVKSILKNDNHLIIISPRG